MTGMKQYVVDQLTEADVDKIRSFLLEKYGKPDVDSIFWLPIDKGALSGVQRAHPDCQPFFAAIELQKERLVCELLVRTMNKMRCSCMGYATERQRNGIIESIDDMLNRLEIAI